VVIRLIRLDASNPHLGAAPGAIWSFHFQGLLHASQSWLFPIAGQSGVDVGTDCNGFTLFAGQAYG
jgi:hypothetical protein